MLRFRQNKSNVKAFPSGPVVADPDEVPMGSSAAVFHMLWLVRRAWAAWLEVTENELPRRLAMRRAVRKRQRVLCLHALKAWTRLKGIQEVWISLE
jgi:hypothetical protein